MDKKALHQLSYGVYAVTTLNQTTPTGCIANSVMQITSNPPTVAVSINHNNYTHDRILKNGAFAVSVLSEHSDPSIIATLGFQSGSQVQKFEALPYTMQGGLPVVNGACAYLLCSVTDTLQTTTHTIILGTVQDCAVMNQEPPMTYAYYQNVKKGKSPKNAPTYQEEETPDEADTVKKFVCPVCGYVYEGESLPENFTCPICLQPARSFIEQK